MGLSENSAVRIPVGLVARARRRQKPWPIEDRDFAPAVVDKPTVLQRDCGVGYTRAAHAEHCGHGPLGDMEHA